MKLTARLDPDLARRLHIAGDRIAARAVARRSRIAPADALDAPRPAPTPAQSTAPPAPAETSPPPPIEQPGGA